MAAIINSSRPLIQIQDAVWAADAIACIDLDAPDEESDNWTVTILPRNISEWQYYEFDSEREAREAFLKCIKQWTGKY